MSQVAAYSVIFLLTFLITAAAAAVTWVWMEQSRSRGKQAAGAPGDSAGQTPSILRNEMLSTLTLLALLLEKFRYVGKLKSWLAEADLDWSVGRTVLMMAAASGVTLNVLLQFDGVPIVAAFLCSLAGGAVPLFYILHRRAKRLRRVEEQLPEALDYLGRALIAGHSLPMSLELLGDEVGLPLSAELRKTVDEYNLGMPMSDALRHLTERVPSVDIQFFVSAILTQSRLGGNFHELLEGLADTIRERSTLKSQVQALTANGRMTAVTLSLLPVFVGAVMMLINPSYFGLLLAHPLGKTLLFMALGGQILAYLVIRKIVDIKV